MSYIARLRDEAEQDIAAAATWYEGQRTGLGHEFLDEMLAVIRRISEDPMIYPIVHRGARRALMTRFPFGVFFRIANQHVVIVAVMHGSRNPRSWQSRT
ncbi:MAG: type II toxin-antitoxin system RelE/ParE family toxin [Proteobacteria bacterium]|nr:type II toxin-antitoxin system RelE/ParE family toxin [Pseudomonadota bacterium]